MKGHRFPNVSDIILCVHMLVFAQTSLSCVQPSIFVQTRSHVRIRRPVELLSKRFSIELNTAEKHGLIQIATGKVTRHMYL